MVNSRDLLLFWMMSWHGTDAVHNRKNVLYMVADDLRPEFGVYCPTCNVITPNIDRLAASGVQFTRAYCQQAICGPSRNSFMSGRRPDTTLTWNFKDNFRTSPKDGGGNHWISMPEYFKINGYDTQGSGKTYHEGSPPNFDLPRSWNNYVPPQYPLNYGGGKYLVCCRQPFNGTGQNCQGGVNEGNSGGGFCRVDNESALFDYIQANHTIELLTNWTADQTPGKPPFFYAVGWKLPHAPWGSPSRTYDTYEPVATKVAVAANKYPPVGAPNVSLITDFFVRLEGDSVSTAYKWSAWSAVPDSVARLNRQAYYAAVTYIDEQIGRVLNSLDTLGLTDSTVVVLHADHGYSLGEHNQWEKKSNYELAARVPLLIRAPGITPTSGAKSDVLVELVDIYPTLASLTGLPPPAGLEQQGIDLKPVLANPSLGASFKNRSFTQYPVCSPPNRVREYPAGSQCPTCGMCAGCSTDTSVARCGTHGCIGVSRTDFYMMGYSVRVDGWRYTAWLPWLGEILTGNWSALPTPPTAPYTPNNYYRELYDHRADNGIGSFDRFENENVAEFPENAAVVQELHEILKAQFGEPNVPQCLNWSKQNFGFFNNTSHGHDISLTLNDTNAAWPRNACDEVVLLSHPDTKEHSLMPKSQFLMTTKTVSQFMDIGFCSPDVNKEGSPWLGYQTGKAFVYRASGLFADSWHLTKGMQGQKYGSQYVSGDVIGAIKHNSTHLEFTVNGLSQGLISTSQPMPPGLVGCVSACHGGMVSTHICKHWNRTKFY